MACDKAVEIAGAGPAGLAAAITLASAGRQVVVYEANGEVGHRFRRDLQGLENWTTRRDVLSALTDFGIDTDFQALPCREGTAFDARGREYSLRSREPMFYMVERGPGPGSLDTALLNRARELGVEVQFKRRVKHIRGPAVYATGPKAADAIAVGYHFDTHMPNGFWVIFDNQLAPQGYAYLLVMNGRGTVKSCMFTGFKDEAMYVKRTISAFEHRVGLEMVDPVPHGGYGNFRVPATALSGVHPVVGEQAGFQDPFWGFGMRLAIHSGVLAANSLLDSGNYDARWRADFGGQMTTAITNRAIYGLLGDWGYSWALSQQQRYPDAREWLRRRYRSSVLKNMLEPLARFYYRSQSRDESCNHINCACVWCRHGERPHS